MGCWNETCAISNLPIRRGDPVVFLLLEMVSFNQKAGYRPQTRSSGYWRPRTLPLYAQYNDYGSIEKWAGSETPVIQNLLRDLSDSLLEREPEPYRLQVKRENLGFPALLDWLHEGKVWVKGFDCPVPIQKVLIRGDVWKTVLEMEFFNYRGEERSWARLIREIPEFLESYRDLSEKESPSLSLLLEPMGRRVEGNLLAQILSSHLLLGIAGREILRGELLQYLDSTRLPVPARNEAREKIEFLLRRFAEVSFVDLVFETTRRAWGPTTGSGSQDTDFSTHLDLLGRISKISYKELREELLERAPHHAGKAWSELSAWEAKYVEEVRRDAEILRESRELGPKMKLPLYLPRRPEG